MVRLLQLVLFSTLAHCVIVYGANILFLAVLPSPSHSLWNYKIVEALSNRGHNLTVLMPDKPKVNLKNSYIISAEDMYNVFYSNGTTDLKEMIDPNGFDEIKMLHGYMNLMCSSIAQTKAFKTLLNYPDNFKFDLIINDLTVESCLLGFLHKFNYPPVIGVSAYKYTTTLVDMVGGHYYSSYIPRPVSRFTKDMDLFQRLENLGLILIESVYHKYIFMPEYNELVSSIFNNKNIPNIEELNKKYTVVLLNTHPALDFPVPLSPNIIEVSGLQISEPKPLPEDILTFISKSKAGAVLIAFGTNVNQALFGEEKQKIIVEVVKKFPNYNFLWKFEHDISNGEVPNLLVKSWLPQNDILAHPKIKAFVSHGGGLSTQEAAWYGVPLVTVPFFMDQRTNSRLLISAGVAVKVDILNFKANDLENAIQTILEDPSYAHRIKILSNRFKDRPMKPLDTAIWWIEYILRDPNPNHLRSPVLDLGQWKANFCDIILYCIILCVVVVFATCKCICKTHRFFSSHKSRKLKEKVKRN